VVSGAGFDSCRVSGIRDLNSRGANRRVHHG